MRHCAPRDALETPIAGIGNVIESVAATTLCFGMFIVQL